MKAVLLSWWAITPYGFLVWASMERNLRGLAWLYYVTGVVAWVVLIESIIEGRRAR